MRQSYDPGPGISISSLSHEYSDRATIEPHFHLFDQLIYATAGVMEVEAQQSRWLIPPQFALWIPARVQHSLRMNGAVSMRTLYVRKGLVRPRDCAVLNVRPLLRELVIEAVRLGNLRARNKIQSALRDVLIEQINTASTAPTALAMPQDPRVRALAERVVQNATSSVSLKTHCRRQGISVRSLQRIFRREVGTNFETWRCQARLMKAIPLLAGGYSIKHVSFDVGYRQPSTFVAMFRRLLGMTPREFVLRARR